MKILEDRIRTDGRIRPDGVLKVDSFLNHQIDVELLSKCGEEWYRLYKDAGITKIVTVEASGIGLACIAAQFFKVPVVFAKKAHSKTPNDGTYTAAVHSKTLLSDNYDLKISKKYLCDTDTALIIDDFLGNGGTLSALISIVEQSGAKLAGVGIAIEKAYQNGASALRAKGYRIESLAKIESMDHKSGVKFC